MEQIEIKNIITSLISNIDSLWFGSTLLESYTTEELRELAVQLDNNQQDYPEKTFRKLLNIILETRCRLMNHNFTWSDENKTRFLEVNENLIQTIQEAQKEALKIFSDVDNRIKGNDAFLKDFEIEISVTPYIKYDEDDDQIVTFADLLAMPYIYESAISYSFEKASENPPIYLDKSLNWNDEYIDGEFDDDYICHPIHALLDTGIWSFQDILDIKTIWTNIEVKYQNYKDI